MRYPLKCVALFFLLTLSIGAGRLYFILTDGFSPRAVAPASTSPNQGDPADLLCKKYIYLAKGAQSYVLASEDGEYVIKFFKKKHFTIPIWQKRLFSLPVVGKICMETDLRRKKRAEQTFTGCQIAYQKMRESSGVIYIHFTPTDHLPPLSMVDKMGYHHLIDLNSAAFYIQRKAVTLCSLLQKCQLKGEIEKASCALNALFAHLTDRSALGVVDRDTNYMNNLGFIKGRAATLDVGSLAIDAETSTTYCSTIIEHTKGMRDWIETHFVQMLPIYESNIDKLRAMQNKE